MNDNDDDDGDDESGLSPEERAAHEAEMKKDEDIRKAARRLLKVTGSLEEAISALRAINAFDRDRPDLDDEA